MFTTKTKNPAVRGLRVLAACLVLAVVGGLADTASAADVLKLKDGRTLEGEIIREVDGYIWLKYKLGGLEQETMFTPSEIVSVERGAESAAANTEPVQKVDEQAAKPARPGVPRGAVLTMEEMVGQYMTAYALQQARPMLEEELGSEGERIVVLRVKSGGGYTLEVQKLLDEIHFNYKPRFHTVGWIDSAISAAAMTSHILEEIYFTPQGNYGACTEFMGASYIASKGRSLEERLHQMEKVSALSGYDYRLMRSMQIDDPLSVTVTPDGRVDYYQDEESGDILVNRKGKILTLNAVTAEKIRFSRGTAATLPELTKAMGYKEIDWIGKDEPGVLWPVTKAERWTQQYRQKTAEDERRLGEYITNYQQQVAAATQVPRDQRGAFVNRARASLSRIVSMTRNNPAFLYFTFNMPTREDFDEWIEDQEQFLRDLMR